MLPLHLQELTEVNPNIVSLGNTSVSWAIWPSGDTLLATLLLSLGFLNRRGVAVSGTVNNPSSSRLDLDGGEWALLATIPCRTQHQRSAPLDVRRPVSVGRCGNHGLIPFLYRRLIPNVRIMLECRSSMFPPGQIIMAFWSGLEYDDFNSTFKEPPCLQIPPNDARRPATSRF